MAQPGFWDAQEAAQGVIQELKALKAVIDPVQSLVRQCEDVQALLDLATEAGDEDTLQEVDGELCKLTATLGRVELMILLSGPNDTRDCFFNIQAGAGGTESQDWTEMLFRMYLRYFERTGYQVEELARKDGEQAGIQSVNLMVRGPYAYGYLSCESGVHRLVRISPFDSNARRHTSFAAVEVLPEMDDIEIDIDWDKDVREDTYRASGAGGQHVNKTSSAVRLTHLATNIVAQCQNERSQHKNRAQARKMLMSRLHRLEEQKRDAELAKVYSERGEIAWGNQIRSYVLQPYQMVKDLRTGHQVGNPTAVLDGEIQDFIEAELRRRASK
jgi:peptide chain release factor 2